MMRPRNSKDHRKTITSLLVSLLLALSLVPSAAIAEASGTAQTAGGVQAAVQAQSQAGGGADAGQLTSALGEADAQEDVKDPHDIDVTVGLPSESNVKKDLCVDLTYNDNFFEKPSSTFNNDLAYASTCLAASADNSNESGNDYKAKSKNIVSYLQQIDCKDIATNDGYNYKPMQKSNIGVAIGYKDIRLNNTVYRLFIFGARGGGYEEEWATNMRVGTEGDATGFQEARDGALGFIMPYIKKHTDGLDGNVNVKIWGSGYCRGGTTVNMVFGWLNKWVYERNNGNPYKAYTQSYNAEHSVYGASYSASEMRYTDKVSFSPAKSGGYLANNVSISQDDLYAYPVNCPFGADASDVEKHERIMTGIHNLINPDDWFPQVVMDWWGFKRYGYTRDHDITGTYATDGALHKRNLSVWNPENATRKKAVENMIARLKKVDPNTAFNSTFFRQQYFSKASAVANACKKAFVWALNKLNFWNKDKVYTAPDVFQLSIDAKGEGNKFYSKDKELKYNQGAYYQEFMKFLLNSAGFPDDPAKARKYYVDNYQDAFVYLMDWVCGQPLEVREKLPKVGAGQVKVAFEQLRDEGASELSKKNPIFNGVGVLLNTTAGSYLSYIGAAIWAVNDSKATIPSALIGRTLKLTFDKLGISYTQGQIDKTSKALGKLAYNYYDKEQDIAKFCFFHSLTMYKAGGSIAQSHWPEQSLAWFSQCKPGDASKKPKNQVNSKTQAQTQAQAQAAVEASEQAGALTAQALTGQVEASIHDVFAYFADDPDVYYEQGNRENGEILGVIDTPDLYDEEHIAIASWNMYDMVDFIEGKPALKTVSEGYEVQASDPENIVLTPNSVTVASKRVNLWLNAAMTGFDKDVLIGSFDVFDGGYYYIAQTALPDGISCEGFDVLYYGDNKDLIDREGVALNGWVSYADDAQDMAGFLPDDFVDYNELPAGDTVDLYAMWYDPAIYGVTYHANRSSSDDYKVETGQFSYDGSTLSVEGLSDDDKGMRNSGKAFVGWNTAADGSGEWFDTGDSATLKQLGLGTRSQYIQELSELAVLEIEETPIHNTEAEGLSAQSDESGESGETAEEFEAKIDAKYTAHLYAQWADDESSDTADKDKTGKKATAKTTKDTVASKTPSTGDSTALISVALAAIAIAIAAVIALLLALGRRRKKREIQ